MKNFYILKLISLMTLSFTLNAQTLNMVFSEKEDADIFKKAQRLIEKINKRANINIKLVSMPRKRAEVELLKNKYIHATFARIKEFQKNNADLIMIEEPIASIPLIIYTHKTLNFTVSSWNSLKEFKIVYVRGTTYIEKYFKNHRQLHALTSEKQAFRFLAAKRADIFISTPLLSKSILDSKEFEESGIKALTPPLKFIDTHSFFNKDYKDIVKKYNKALISLKKDGSYYDVVYEEK